MQLIGRDFERHTLGNSQCVPDLKAMKSKVLPMDLCDQTVMRRRLGKGMKQFLKLGVSLFKDSGLMRLKSNYASIVSGENRGTAKAWWWKRYDIGVNNR